MNKPLKNFSTFLKENWTDKLEEFVDDVVEKDDNGSNSDISGDETENFSEEETTEEADATVEEPAMVEPIEPSIEPASLPAASCDDKSCKVVFLCGVVATMGKENANTIISAKLKEKLCGDNCKEVHLFQLNIQPASEGEEPMDGMVQVYDAVKEADAIVVCSDLKKGQISSVLQTTLERLSNHFKNKELRNKVFGSVITGQEDAHQSVKSSLLNFANNMGMIVGGDCNVFCCISEGESLGDCDHNYEADTTCAATCIKELCCATASIRGAVQDKPVPSIDPKPITAISSILNFDDFENTDSEEVEAKADTEDDLGYDDDGEAEEEDDDLPAEEDENNKIVNFDEFAGEEEDFEDEAADEEAMEEEEEGYYYDYNNNICHNRTETPMTKPNPVKLTKESKGCGKKGCGNCKCKKTNESTLLNFVKFMNKNKRK